MSTQNKRSSGHGHGHRTSGSSTTSGGASSTGAHGHGRRRRRSVSQTKPETTAADVAQGDEEFFNVIEEKIAAITVEDADDESDPSDEGAVEEAAEKLQKQGFWFRKKKGLVGKLSTSTLGGALFKKYMDEETISLMALAKRLAQDFKDKDTAEKLHRRVMRVATKTLMLYDNNTFTGEEFAKFRVPFRKICAIIKNNYARNIWDEKVIDRIVELIGLIVDGLTEILKKHVSDKTLGKLNELREFYTDKKFIEFAHDKEPKDWKELVAILSYYLEET